MGETRGVGFVTYLFGFKECGVIGFFDYGDREGGNEKGVWVFREAAREILATSETSTWVRLYLGYARGYNWELTPAL